MKVVQINRSDNVGGAGIAGFRCHQSVLRQGIDSCVVVERSNSPDERTTVFAPSLVSASLWWLGAKFGLGCVSSIAGYQLMGLPQIRNADIVHLNNVHGGLVSLHALTRLNKPVVWTLHDMWPLTSHSYYTYGCRCWETAGATPPLFQRCDSGCGDIRAGSLPRPNEQVVKQWCYRRMDMTVIAPSRWLADVARRGILGEHEVRHIPYCLDTAKFRPLDKREARRSLGLEGAKRVLMAAAENLGSRRKGADLLLAALGRLPPSLQSGTTVILMGEQAPDIERIGDIEMRRLGVIEDDAAKARAYSAADLFILPTRADNLPLVLQESLSCGTPMVSFDVGGVSDIVRPGMTGELATPEDAESLASRIAMLLGAPEEILRRNALCRQIAVAEYSPDVIGRQYADVYRDALARRSPAGGLPELAGRMAA